jgi:hypothetical protein
MIKNEVENWCFNEKGNYQEIKKEWQNQEDGAKKEFTILLCAEKKLAVTLWGN